MRRKLRTNRLLTVVFTALAIIIAFLAIFSLYRYGEFSSTEGFTPVSVSSIAIEEEEATIELRNGCSRLTMIVSVNQGQSIQLALSGIEQLRPGTHDIIADILEMYGIKTTAVKITRLSAGTYYAQLLTASWNRFLALDIRPSDAIAVALKTGTPIYVADNLLEKVC